MHIQGVQTLSAKSNFDILIRKSGQISKLRVNSWSQKMHNLFYIIIRDHSQTIFRLKAGFNKVSFAWWSLPSKDACT